MVFKIIYKLFCVISYVNKKLLKVAFVFKKTIDKTQKTLYNCIK